MGRIETMRRVASARAQVTGRHKAGGYQYTRTHTKERQVTEEDRGDRVPGAWGPTPITLPVQLTAKMTAKQADT